MKKWLIISGIILFIIMAIIIGVNLLNNKNDVYNIQPSSEKELAQNIDYNEIDIVTTSSNEEIISPNAIINFETYFEKCKHTEIKRIDADEQFVNMSKEDIKKKFNDWDIVNFNANEVILRNQKKVMCSQHYILKENNGYIAIFTVDELGKETLKEMTGIVVAYLTQTDLEELKEGIKIYGKENLNAKLEDYE